MNIIGNILRISFPLFCLTFLWFKCTYDLYEQISIKGYMLRNIWQKIVNHDNLNNDILSVNHYLAGRATFVFAYENIGIVKTL